MVNVAGTDLRSVDGNLQIGSTYYHIKSDTYDINGHLELIVDLVEWGLCSFTDSDCCHSSCLEPSD